MWNSTGLQDLNGACVCFETHVELGTRAYKSNEGLCTVKGNDSADLALDELTRPTRKLGYALRPWIDRKENRQQGNRGFGRQDNRDYGGPSRYQNGGKPSTRTSQVQPERERWCAHTEHTEHTESYPEADTDWRGEMLHLHLHLRM